MNTQLLKEYRRLRAASPFMVVGHNAEQALKGARTILAFRALEDAGRVRIVAEPEEENYFDVYGKPDSEKDRERIAAAIEANGLWWVHADVLPTPCECCGNGEDWENVDAIGMCVYSDPCSPYENAYMLGLMATAVEKAQA